MGKSLKKGPCVDKKLFIALMEKVFSPTLHNRDGPI